MKYEFRWISADGSPGRWEPTCGLTEQDAADHLAQLAGSTCPVPGAYRRGTKGAKKISANRWLLPTGAEIEIRDTLSEVQS